MAKKKEEVNNTPVQPIPEIYTNAALTNFSPYEFEITVGLNSSNYEGPRPLANIRMSPQFAKEFANILLKNVNLYEENFGKLPEPESDGSDRKNLQ